MKGKTLVTYFSAQGTTAAVAEILAAELNADLFEIKPTVPYTADDLNWMNKRSRSSVEMGDENCRPEIAESIDVSDYENILIGFPVWWYVEPRIVDTFLESQNFSGKTVIPFATSGGSGIEKAVKRMKSLCSAANWKDGKLLSSGSAAKWAKSI